MGGEAAEFHFLSFFAPQDVRLYTALCLSDVLRIFAPREPYEDDETLKVSTACQRDTFEKAAALCSFSPTARKTASVDDVFPYFCRVCTALSWTRFTTLTTRASQLSFARRHSCRI